MQEILSSKNNYFELQDYIKKNPYHRVMIVCSKHFYQSKLYEVISNLEIDCTYFDEFEPNPRYESVVNGLKIFRENKCDSIIAVGGGSAIDVAKCIKAFLNMNSDENYLKQEIIPNDIPFLAVPTTAGTGSEATHFAVIYYNGEKQSVANQSLIPTAVLLDTSSLSTLPIYQKKTTLFDAFSHAIESMWSLKSNDESISYSIDAIKLLTKNMDEYFENQEETFESVLKAAHLAGKAINLTTTTAGHAMCYKLTSLYHIAHGHAAILVNSELYPYMIEHIDQYRDKRGKDYLIDTLTKISKLLGYQSLEESKDYFRKLLKKYQLYDVDMNLEDMNELVHSVNIERLSNHPIELKEEDINEIYQRIYHKIMEEKNESN